MKTRPTRTLSTLSVGLLSLVALPSCGQNGFFSDRYIDTDYTIQTARERDEQAVAEGKPTIKERLVKANKDELRQEIIQRIKENLRAEREKARRERALAAEEAPDANRQRNIAALKTTLSSVLQKERRERIKRGFATISFDEDKDDYQERILQTVRAALAKDADSQFILGAITPEGANTDEQKEHTTRARQKISEVANVIISNTGMPKNNLSYSIISRNDNTDTIVLRIKK